MIHCTPQKNTPLVWLVLFCLLIFAPLLAQENLSPTELLKYKLNVKNTVLSPELTHLSKEYDLHLRQKKTTDYKWKYTSPLMLTKDKVVVEIICPENTENITRQLQKMGMQKATCVKHLISGILPIGQLEKVSKIKGIRSIYPVYKPERNVGKVTSQGDIALQSNLAREIFDVNGKGLTIGVLSDSYDNLGGAADGIASGDLPGKNNPNGFTDEVNVLLDFPIADFPDVGTIDEGRAMIEIIHDVAPGAKIAFNTAFLGQPAFAQGIKDLHTVAKAEVIVDDVIYFAEPFFADGIVAQAVDEVTADGALYFSSAGNSGRVSYDAAFTDSGEDFSAFGFNWSMHAFAAGDVTQQISIPPGSSFGLVFQWNEPFLSVTGDKGGQSDLDVFFFDDSGNFEVENLLAVGATDNIGLDPWEVVSFGNSTDETIVGNLVIASFEDTGFPDRMKYIESGSVIIEEYEGNEGTCVGHANAEGAFAIGAAPYIRTPAYGFNPPLLEPFSSAGGVPILLDKAGNPQTPIVRQKPNFVGPDGANTTFFIPGLDPDQDGFPNFFGTSASAPHVAAVTALLLEANPNLTRTDVHDLYRKTAYEMLSPGFDFDSGWGYVNAQEAVKRSLPLYVNCSDEVLVTVDAAGAVYWELPEPTAFCEDCVEDDIEGFHIMGFYQGHSYYCSDRSFRWYEGQNISNQLGGYLATVTTSGENNFLLSNLHGTTSAYIGLNDRFEEGTFKWESQEPVNYTPWNIAGSNNADNRDVVRLLNNGKWDVDNSGMRRKFITEFPCVEIEQLSGSINGSNLSAGTYEVTYRYTSLCGDTEVCTFNVVVPEAIGRIDFRNDIDLFTSTLTGFQVGYCYPNPANHSNQLFIPIHTNIATDLVVELVDINGRNVLKELYNVEEGQQTLAISLPPLASGLFFVKINNGQEQVLRKWMN